METLSEVLKLTLVKSILTPDINKDIPRNNIDQSTSSSKNKIVSSTY
jgi:hypothetical protein